MADRYGDCDSAGRPLIRQSYPKLVIPPPRKGRGSDGEASAKWYTSGPCISARQGWKLYVSAARPFFLDTLEAAGRVFSRHNVPYKYVASDKVLRKLNAGLYGYSQIGKVIVAYFAEAEDVSAVVPDLKGALRDFRHRAPHPPFAIPLGGGFPLSYRFGAFDGTLLRLGGHDIEDDRTRSAEWIRDFIHDPFVSFGEPPVRRPEFDRLLSRFPVYEVLAQGGKGGIYAAFDLEAGEFCDLILKVGCRHGQVLPDGRDGMDLLRNEKAFFDLLEVNALSHLAPRLHGYFECGDRNVLAMERIEGQDLLKRKVDGTLAVSHAADCLAVLSQLHDVGLCVGDPKLANFIADQAGRVWAIDFESAGRISQTTFDLVRTFHFSRPKLQDIATRETLHFLYSILHNNEPYSFSESDRIIDLINFIQNVEPMSEVEKWAFDKIKNLL